MFVCGIIEDACGRTSPHPKIAAKFQKDLGKKQQMNAQHVCRRCIKGRFVAPLWISWWAPVGDFLALPKKVQACTTMLDQHVLFLCAWFYLSRFLSLSDFPHFLLATKEEKSADVAPGLPKSRAKLHLVMRFLDVKKCVFVINCTVLT